MTDTQHADFWGPNIRRVRDPKDSLVLLCQELVDGKWVTFHSANEMSNDYAYTETSGVCRRQATKHIGGH